jgi:hypothetical protein
MLQVGSEPMIPLFERVKIVHALEHVATVISNYNSLVYEIQCI